MATKRRIKFIKAWNMFGIGAELELDAPIADLLIQRGRAEEIKVAQPPAPIKTLKKKRRNKLRNAHS